MVRIELLEHIGGVFGICLDGVDDLLALRVRGPLYEVGDLGGMQPFQWTDGHQQPGSRHVTHERLNFVPVQNRSMSRAVPTARARYEALQYPARIGVHSN